MGEPTPVARGERIVAIDVIRGFALLGVLLMNNHDFYRGPAERYAFSPHPDGGLANVASDWILWLFFESKSVTLFSFLFGVGLAIQLERVLARGHHFGRYAARRLGALFAFGALHVVLLWWGDILHIYAFLGVCLLPFLRRQPRTLFIWGMIFLAAPWVVVTGIALYQAGTVPPPYNPGAVVASYAAALRGYTQDGWLAVAAYRLNDWVEQTRLVTSLRFDSYGLGLFLLGAAAWKRGILTHPERHAALLRRFIVIALPIGLALTFASLLRWHLHPYTPTRLGRWLTLTRYLVAPPLMALSYASALLLLLGNRAWRARLAPLSFIGRMALTCYLSQSLVMTWIYNGYGGGLYGRVGPALAAGLAVALFAAQIVFARWWLERHEHGPVEHLWRVLTYGRRSLGVSTAT